MARAKNTTGVERYFNEDELIVSKTNLKGHLTYCNDIFLSIAGYTEAECLGQPHSMIRHPDMPRAVFALLWQTLLDGREIFAYVMNRCKNGDHYWVLAHVTPSRDANGAISGFHSSRRVPDRSILENHIMPLYRDLQSLEKSHKNRKEGLKASMEMITGFLKEKNMEYDQFIATLAA